MSWYICITNPNCQRKAEAGLAELDYSAFWPRLKRWVSHARVRRAKEFPILGRYLFVEIPDGNFWAVRNVHGIEGFLLGYDGAPAECPEEIVWYFRDRYMRGEWDYVTPETGEFINEKGQPEIRRNKIPMGALVRIMEGEFAGILTVIRGKSKNGKLKFLPPGKRDFYFTREQNVRAA